MREPLYFYKFVLFERKDVLKDGQIRFAPLDSFNDPFELKPTITPYSRQYLNHVSKLSEAEVRAIKFDQEDMEYSSERVEQVAEYKDKYKKEISKFGVLSLSTNQEVNQLLTVSMRDKKDPRTNILMWSHYAGSHQGFVIEFRRDFINGIEINEVEYSDDRDYLTFEDINDNNLDKIFYKKSKEWKYEQEYRAVMPLDAAATIHDDKYHLFKINKSSVNSITFGCAMSEENKETILSIINNDDSFDRVVFNHARLSDEGFFLDFYQDDGHLTNDPKSSDIMSIPNQKKF